ncbi:hypothetical protein VNO77_34538 [Canavalia gladiata]|uniref:Uncharacterized protein n=1 Tax=Canavalia gladiata TaxID=3824 RepID=A0AAN9KHQ2_CANGL
MNRCGLRLILDSVNYESHNDSLRCKYLRLDVDGNLRWKRMATQENMGDAYAVVSPLFCTRLVEQSTSIHAKPMQSPQPCFEITILPQTSPIIPFLSQGAESRICP